MGLFRRRKSTDDQAETPAPSGPPGATVEELNPAEIAWLDGLLGDLAAAGVDADDLAQVERHYDEHRVRWGGLPEPERPDPQLVINRVGAGLGHHLAARTGLRWVIATDQYGTELALHGQPGDVLVFPPNMVGKRWADGETGFLVGLADFTVQRVAELQGR